MTIDLTLLPRVACRRQEVTAPRLRGLLALLAGDLRTGCSTERLVEGLWPDELPERPGKALQVLVSRARAQLGADLIVSTPTGYRLDLAADQVDSSALLLHAAASADRARAGDHAGSLAAAEAGLALWEGTPDQGADSDDPVAALRAERAPVHDALVRARALALARLGRHAEASGPLAVAAAAHPRDEEVLGEVLRGEAATAGPSAALTRYEAYRRELRDELGTDPGPGLKAVQQELLRGEAPLARHGVPHEPNPLLGRDDDIGAVEGLLRVSRAVTVVGPGGLGKTRLAHAVSRRAEQRLVYFVPLAGVTEDADVAAEVASVLGAGAMNGPASGDPVSGILGVLGSGPALLVLDNCEQVVRGAADLVQALVSSSKDLRVLATSRSPLGLTSEAVYALPELGLAVSVELFTQRARAARSGVELPSDAVAELCRHLDGLPLAVELAAARVRVLSVPDIARRLGDRFALLRGGARDVPERHRTLHAVVEWSWNLLDEDARAALRTLSVFPGGFSGEAAEQVLGEDALLLLEQLADQSLVTVADTAAGVRFRMLETVREFSAARRTEAGENEAAVDQFLVWAREFGVAHHDVLFGSDSQAAWERIKAEQDNLVAALRHAQARLDHPATAALTAVLASLWSTGTNYPRLIALTADTGPALSHYHPEPEYLEVARTAAVLGTVTVFMGQGPRAVRQLVTLRRLPAAPPDSLMRAASVVLSAIPEIRPPGYDVLRRLSQDRQPLLSGIAECVACYVWEFEHDIERALVSARRTVVGLAAVDNPSIQLMVHSRLSELCLRAGRGEEAYEHLKASLAVLPRLGDGHDHIGVRSLLALACLQRGEVEEAEYWLRQTESDNPPPEDDFYRPDLGGRAEIALARGLTEVGLGLWRGAVERMLAAGSSRGAEVRPDPWAFMVQSVAVTAHARAGRLALVADTVDRLRGGLGTLLAESYGSPSELPLLGTMLHALGMIGFTEDDPSAVRMIALAERLGVFREFQPTMSADLARQAAEDADRAAYTDAVSEYAALGRDELRDAARAVMATTSGRG
ncbi:BTAD domain-containing putative transcriptional regulator [Streptomyces sp. NPDC001642]|uniref:ATP-binding protein n=1 Tax=Streptomyces sp. NPDC001642 TaxID=3154392 RepID=UPI0033168344